MTIGDDGALQLQSRIFVPNMDNLRELILVKNHCSRYYIHPGFKKIYRDLKQHYWWRRMKKDIIGSDEIREKGKLSSRFIGPFEVSERVGEVAYILDFPTSLLGVNPVDENLAYKEEPVAILDRQVRKLKSKEIALVKFQWRSQSFEEVTWEAEHDMRSRNPNLFGISACELSERIEMIMAREIQVWDLAESCAGSLLSC
nr:uncharacterized protein LOC117275126 [Nicotiana tomentosiformis]